MRDSCTNAICLRTASYLTEMYWNSKLYGRTKLKNAVNDCEKPSDIVAVNFKDEKNSDNF